MSRIHVNAAYDKHKNKIEVTPGVIDEDVIYLYTTGQCLAFVIALNKKTKWKLIGEGWNGPSEWAGYDNIRYPYQWEHTFVQHLYCTDGKLLYDIQGAHDPENISESHTLYKYSKAELLSTKQDFVKQSWRLAETFVEPMLSGLV
jgi:hypothetical protein